MSAAFFSAKVTKKSAVPYVPRPVEEGGSEVLQLTGACVPASCPLKAGTRLSLMAKVGDADEFVAMCTLVVGQLDSVSLGHILEEYSEFTVDGPPKSEIHVTGFYNPQPGAGGDAEEDDEEALRNDPMFSQLLGAPSGYDPDAADDEDDDDDDEDDDEEEDEPLASKRKVEITDITDQGKKPKSNGKASPAKAAAADEDDDEDDEEDDDEEGEESEDDEDEDEEEEEEEPAKPQAVQKLSQGSTPGKENAAKKRGAEENKPAPAPKRAKHSKFANGFEVISLHENTDPKAVQAAPGKKVFVKYRGTLKDGKVFDETPGNKRFGFRLGAGEVIKGWDKGLVGMREGDKRKLIVPPSMAYGSTGVDGVIPKDATLTFEVELLKVK